MLRDSHGEPVDEGGWFVPHGTGLTGDVETRWDGAVPHLTPVERFFVRNHTEPPRLDAAAWRLRVTGDGVERELELSLDDLQGLGATTTERTLECTGNGRRYFAEQQGAPRPGTPWAMWAVGLARWTGVPLRTVLEHAELRAGAVQVMATGLDPTYVEDGVDHGRVRRPLPLAKALADTLVAWAMNGQPLPPDHGFPARLLVPGWVGIASIKWLGELRVTTAVEESPWSTRWYRMHGPACSDAEPPLGRMPPKSVLDTAGLPTAGEPTVLRGRAWSGEASIDRVQVSTDGGRGWTDAALVGPNEPSSWVAWELPWTPARAGEHEVLTRATDSLGRTQPEVSPDNEEGYLFSAVLRQRVTVG